MPKTNWISSEGDLLTHDCKVVREKYQYSMLSLKLI